MTRLRVGAFQAAALHLLPPAMTALRHQRAEVDLSVTDIQSSDAVDLVARGDLDLAVLASWDAPPVVPAGLRLTGILEDPMVLAFADDHRLARGTTPVALASLAEESWVLIRGGSAAREQFDRITREAGFEPRIRFETESYDVAQALVATGYGIALVSRMGRRTGPGIAHRPVQHRAAHRTIHTCDTPMKQQTSPSHSTACCRQRPPNCPSSWRLARVMRPRKQGELAALFPNSVGPRPLGSRQITGATKTPLARWKSVEHRTVTPTREGDPMPELLVDFITSLDGYGAAEGWPGWWGLEGPEYLAWLQQQPDDSTILMGATTYRLMSELARGGEPGTDVLEERPKVVFSTTLTEPLAWPNTQLVSHDPVAAVREMKTSGSRPLTTLGSVTLCRALLKAGLVDRFRVGIFPVITGNTGTDRIYDGYPDVALDLVESRTFDGRIQILEYIPRVLSGPPGTTNPNASA